MAGRSGSRLEKVRGKKPKTQFASDLSETVSETVRLWRKHHLKYDQTKYVVEQASALTKNDPPRLGKSDPRWEQDCAVSTHHYPRRKACAVIVET